MARIDVKETEFELDPANPKLANAGVVVFDVSNEGKVDHNLEVEGPGGEVELPQNVKPGESATLEVDLSAPGTYEWYCPVGDHRDRGMKGAITVAAGAPSTDGGESTAPEQNDPPGSGGY